MITTIPDAVSAFLRRQGLARARLVVAVSGGPDSVCLMHVLAGLKEELSLALHVAHLDHGLRADSAADAAYTKQLAERLGLPVTLEKADVQGYRREKGLGLEEAGREVRYRFLARLAGELGTPYILTGHTRNDQVETILLHIIRGTGLKGLAGLKSLISWTPGGQEAVLARPLLEIGRAETEGYCAAHGLQPRRDATNLSLGPLRNRIRLELIPRLTEYNPGIEESLLRLAAATDIDMAYLEETVVGVWDGVVRDVDGVAALDKAALLGLPAALQRYLVRRALGRLLGGLKDIEMRHIEYIMSNLHLAAGQCLSLPGGAVFAVDYDCYWLGHEEDLPSPYPPFSGEHHLKIPGVTPLPGWQVEAALVKGPVPPEMNRLVAYFDAEALGRELVVRPWRHGDRFVPLGQEQKKKLGRFMIAAKIPRRWRENIPLVVSPQQVAWLVGCRLDNRVKMTAATERALRLEFRKI